MDDKVLELPNYTVYFPDDILFDINDMGRILNGLAAILHEIQKDIVTPDELLFEEFCNEIAETFNDFIVNDKEVSIDYFFFDDEEEHLIIRLES